MQGGAVQAPWPTGPAGSLHRADQVRSIFYRTSFFVWSRQSPKGSRDVPCPESSFPKRASSFRCERTVAGEGFALKKNHTPRRWRDPGLVSRGLAGRGR
jgi:hypothetical protein